MTTTTNTEPIATEAAANAAYYAENLLASLTALAAHGPEAIADLRTGDLLALGKALGALLDEDGDAALIFNTMPLIDARTGQRL